MAAKWKTAADFGITHIFFIFLFFNGRPGSCQPICGIIIANKSFSSAKVALVCSFRAGRKNRRHVGCRNVMRSRGCAVQNKGITLKLLYLRHFSPPWTLFEVGGAKFIMNSKINLRKINFEAYFKAILHYFGLNPLSGSAGDGWTEVTPVFDLINRSHRSVGKEPIHCWFCSM